MPSLTLRLVFNCAKNAGCPFNLKLFTQFRQQAVPASLIAKACGYLLN
jgi:hypothetical protein